MPYKNHTKQLINQRAAYHKHKEARKLVVKAYKARWYKNNRELSLSRVRKRRLERLYGLTSTDYFRMLDIQDGHCALCPQLPLSHKRLAIDHNHQTGKVRGLLCLKCNTALERLETVPLWHEHALSYLEVAEL